MDKLFAKAVAKKGPEVEPVKIEVTPIEDAAKTAAKGTVKTDIDITVDEDE